MAKRKLLVVDDKEDVRQATRRAFEQDFEIFEASDKDDALRVYDAESTDVVFLDIDLDGRPAGWHILEQIRRRERKVLVLLVTGARDVERHPLFSQADGFFAKPFDLDAVNAFLLERGMLSETEDISQEANEGEEFP